MPESQLLLKEKLLENDPLYKEIKEALRQLNQPVSKEELQKQIDELEKIKREKGLKALGDELFKRAGLK